MNIWQISTRQDENIILTAKEKEFKKLDCFLCGESMSDRWNPTLSLYVDEKRTNVAYSDALSFAAAYFVLSERALKIFQEFAKDRIECLEFQCKQEGYLIVNPLEYVDCLDMERSEYKVYKGAPNKIQFYTKLCFVKGDLEGKHLFRIKHMDECLMACSDAFKEALESAGMIGFQFKKLSDEIVDERAPKGSIKKESTNVAKKELKDYFLPAKTGEKCCICGKENIDFYVGYAYEDEKLIVFSEDRERFCCDCLVTRRAAQEKNIIFNNKFIKDFEDLTEEKRHTLLYCTPCLSHNFDTNEDIWAVCCDDFCCYTGSDFFSAKFQCVECGKKISWKHFT